jgi:2-phosphosulfolactate phosphatase
VLRSANGAVCVRAAEHAHAVLIGALVNATAVAREATWLAQQFATSVTVVACGERWQGSAEAAVGGLRVALEDALGAGAILAALPGEMSPEARVCAAAFRAQQANVMDLLWECGSGRELRARGFAGDVTHAARLDCYDCAPQLISASADAPGFPRIEAAER